MAASRIRIPLVAHPTPPPPLHPELEPLEMTQTERAERIDVPFQRVNGLVNGRRGLTPDTALRLSKVFGTSAGFWMNHQLRWDLYHAQQDAREALKRITPVRRKVTSS